MRARAGGYGAGLGFRLLGEAQADAHVLAHQQHQQDAHHNEVADDRARQPREVHQQKRHEQRESERDDVELRHGALPPQHGDHLVQKIDGRRHAARGDHDEQEAAELLEVQSVQEAHDGDADPSHDKGRRSRVSHDDHHDKDDDQVELPPLLGVAPRLGHAYEQRFVDEPDGQQNALRGEVQRVEVQLVVVGEHALHDELRHVVDERVQKQRQEQREALLEKPRDAGRAHAARLRRFEQGQREREHHERQGRGHGHDDARHRQVAGDEQAQRERHEHHYRAERLRGAGQVQLVHLLQPPLVHVGQAVHHLVHVHA